MFGKSAFVLLNGKLAPAEAGGVLVAAGGPAQQGQRRGGHGQAQRRGGDRDGHLAKGCVRSAAGNRAGHSRNIC